MTNIYMNNAFINGNKTEINREDIKTTAHADKWKHSLWLSTRMTPTKHVHLQLCDDAEGSCWHALHVPQFRWAALIAHVSLEAAIVGTQDLDPTVRGTLYGEGTTLARVPCPWLLVKGYTYNTKKMILLCSADCKT